MDPGQHKSGLGFTRVAPGAVSGPVQGSTRTRCADTTVLGEKSSELQSPLPRLGNGDNFGPLTLRAGSPASVPQTSASCGVSSGLRLEIKCTVNVMHLKVRKTIPPTPALVYGKIVFHEISPWCQKGWGPLA